MDLPLIIDGHLDLAYNALFHRRDLTRPIDVLREREDPGPGAQAPGHPDSLRDRPGVEALGAGVATVCLPELRSGGVGLVFGTIMARVQLPTDTLNDGVRTQEAACAIGQSHLHYYRALERRGELRIIRRAADLEAHLEDWHGPRCGTPVGLVVSMESADPILGPDQVEAWWESGLRSVSLTHFGVNTWGHGSGTRGGLYPPAYPLLDALRSFGVALDITHAADLAFWELLEYWDGPIHASHAMCRALVPGQRQLSDEMIGALAERDGVVGMVLCEPMVNPAAGLGAPPLAATGSRRPIAAIAEHIDHICQLTGSCRHVAIGSDLDGGFGREWSPVDLDTIADLRKLLAVLERRGYCPADIDAIAHGNLLRLLGRILPGDDDTGHDDTGPAGSGATQHV